MRLILIDKLEDNKSSIIIEYSTRMQEILPRENDDGIINFSSKESQIYLRKFKLIQ